MDQNKLISRIYPGQMARPTPEVKMGPQGQSLIVAFPWGSTTAVRQACQNMLDYFTTAQVDREATSPFAKMPGISPIANLMRNSVLLGNETLFQKQNFENYATGCELLMLTVENHELTYVSIGQPHMCILRKGELIPVSVAHDLNVDFSAKAPLPSKLLGLDKTLEFETRSAVFQKGDKLVLLARSKLPGSFFSEDLKKKTKQQAGDKLFNLAVQDNEDQPFWLGLLEL